MGSVRAHWEVGALDPQVVGVSEEFLDPLGIPRFRPRPNTHNHPARLAITHTASELSAISSSAIGYPNAHRSSGMCAKFMP